MICTFPPPLHGQSMVSESLREHFRGVGYTVSSHDISPGRRRAWRYHARRIATVLAAGRSLIVSRDTPVYLSSEAGFGVFYLIYLILCARLGSKKLILHHHVFSYIRDYSFWHHVAIRLAGRECYHILLSPYMDKHFQRQFGEQHRRLVVYNSVFVDRSLRRGRSSHTESAPLHVGFLGRLERAKGFDIFLDVMRRLKDEPDFHFVVGGDYANSPYADELAAVQRQLGERLHLAGFVDGECKVKFFSELDVLLFPSRYANEASPMVCFEALAMGVPVVAADIGAIGDIIPPAGGEVLVLDDAFATKVTERLRDLAVDRRRLAEWRHGAAATFETLDARGQEALRQLAAVLGEP
jgi:glycosyltransferase involved in cell wall biosynthesis